MQKGIYSQSVHHHGFQSILLETVKMPERIDPIPRSWQRSHSLQWIHMEASLVQHTSFCVIPFTYSKYFWCQVSAFSVIFSKFSCLLICNVNQDFTIMVVIYMFSATTLKVKFLSRNTTKSANIWGQTLQKPF